MCSIAFSCEQITALLIGLMPLTAADVLAEEPAPTRAASDRASPRTGDALALDEVP